MFTEFLDGRTLTADQLEFLDLVIDHLTARGVMDPKLPYEAPFTDFDRTSVPPLLRATHTVPIVFANVPNPVGSGIVDSLARPGGNITGLHDAMLKEVARGLKRVAVLRDATITPGDRSVCRHPVGRAIARG